MLQGIVVLGQADAAPAGGEAAAVGQQRRGPQRLDGHRVGLREGERGDEVLAAQERGLQVLEDGGVLLLGEDGVVSLEAVLVEQGLVTDGLDIYAISRVSATSPPSLNPALRGSWDFRTVASGAGPTKQRVLKAEKLVFFLGSHDEGN